MTRDNLIIFAVKKTRASGRNIGKVFNPVVKLVLENQPFLMQMECQSGQSIRNYQFLHRYLSISTAP